MPTKFPKDADIPPEDYGLVRFGIFMRTTERIFKRERNHRERVWQHRREVEKTRVCHNDPSHKTAWCSAKGGYFMWYRHPTVIGAWICQSCSVKGRRHTVETKGVIAQASALRKWTPAQRLQMSMRMRGSNSHSYGRRGEKAYHWKGGITPIQTLVRHMPEMREWRQSVFERDNYTCHDCGQVGHKLHVHHLYPFHQILKDYNIKSVEEARQCKTLWDTSNGITQCTKCHRAFHQTMRIIENTILAGITLKATGQQLSIGYTYH